MEEKGKVFQKVGVIGCGTMGAGIAMRAAQSGYETIMLDVDMTKVNSGINGLKIFADRSIEKGKLTEEEKDKIFSNLKGTVQYRDLSECDIVIEAVSENLRWKQKIFTELETIVSREAILASNTSSIPISEIAKATKYPERVVGIHFFNPPQIMKLVEVVAFNGTKDEVRLEAADFAMSLEKTVIFAKDNPGFIVNYLQYPFRLHAIRMVQEGLASAEDIDTAAKLGLGHPKGPLELQDMVGLDITYNACKTIFEATGDPLFEPPKLMEEMIKENRLGRKTGKGFYDYR